MTVLVVDDETKMAQLLRRALSGAGFGVEVTDDGESAVALMGKGSYEALILDVVLPGIDGMEVCRRLRATVSPLRSC